MIQLFSEPHRLLSLLVAKKRFDLLLEAFGLCATPMRELFQHQLQALIVSVSLQAFSKLSDVVLPDQGTIIHKVVSGQTSLFFFVGNSRGRRPSDKNCSDSVSGRIAISTSPEDT